MSLRKCLRGKGAVWASNVVILLIALSLRFWALGAPALFSDEAYYWEWSRRLAPCYYDNPAATALLVRASTTLFGTSEWAIRSLNAAVGVACVAATVALARRLSGTWPGALAASLVACCPGCLLIARFTYTDGLHLLLLLLATHQALALLPPKSGELTFRGAAQLGLTWALLLNTKYSAYLASCVAVVTLLWALYKRPARRPIWVALALAILGLLPALIWNATHDWVSYRWQIGHFGRGVLGTSRPTQNLASVADYLGLPASIVVGLGVLNLKDPPRILLGATGLALTLPIVLSPTNSPRNAASGAVLLMILGSDWVLKRVGALASGRPAARAALLALLVANGVLGLGTALESVRPTRWPHSRAATHLRRSGAGWRRVEDLRLDPARTVLAIDYSIAGQISYYSGRPAFTSWGQYRLWAQPKIESVSVVSLTYVDSELIQSRLRESFAEVTGPRQARLSMSQDSMEVLVWAADGPLVEADALLDRLDLLGLAEDQHVRPKQ